MSLVDKIGDWLVKGKQCPHCSIVSRKKEFEESEGIPENAVICPCCGGVAE